MKTIIDTSLEQLTANGNLRRLPNDSCNSGRIDLSSNDYLGLASRPELQQEFLQSCDLSHMQMSSSASRLLSRIQQPFAQLEQTLSQAYGDDRAALLFNSGYHANTGLISAFAGTGAFILADKLVHASIIDGIKLSGLPFARFRHNDYDHLGRLAQKAASDGMRLVIVAESVYSMDGDSADIDALAEVKRQYPESLLYIDEAHAIGVEGPAGLGLAMASNSFRDVDILVGTFGKALASSGAFAILSRQMREYMVNKARSLIFSTALPPISVLWSRFIFNRALGMDTERIYLKRLGHILSKQLAKVGGTGGNGHIQPLIIGNPATAVTLSQALQEEGYDVLPIRTPTVPPGTDRLRFSLSAAISTDSIAELGHILEKTVTR